MLLCVSVLSRPQIRCGFIMKITKSSLLFVFFSTFQIEASFTCYELLKEKHEIARHFDENLLSKVNGFSTSSSRAALQRSINYSMLNYIIEQVQRSPRFEVKEHAKEALFQANPSSQENLVRDSVRLAHSKSQYIEMGEENFFRFLPREISKGPLLFELKKAIEQRRFSIREVRYNRRDSRLPELVGDVTLSVEGNVFTFRFAVVIPQNQNAFPILSLFSPRIDSFTQGKLICVYRSCRFQEHLVITDWERGIPKSGSVIENSAVLVKEKISRPVEELLKSSEEDSVFLKRFFYRIQGVQENYDWKLVVSNNNPLKASVAEVFARKPDFRLSSVVRSQLSSYPFIGYKGGISYEHGAVQHAQPVFSKINFSRDYTANFFPDSISKQEVLDALKKNILEKRFQIQEEKLNSSDLIFAFSNLHLQGEEYPVEFSFRIQEEEKASLYLGAIHPLVISGLSNHMVSVYIDLRLPRMFVVTQWKEGVPVQGAFIQR